MAGSPNTLPRRRLVRGPVVGTDDIALILAKKMVIHPIQRQREMATTVHVGTEVPFVAHQQAFDGTSLTPKPKLLGHPVRELVGAGDHFAPARSFLPTPLHDLSPQSES